MQRQSEDMHPFAIVLRLAFVLICILIPLTLLGCTTISDNQDSLVETRVTEDDTVTINIPPYLFENTMDSDTVRAEYERQGYTDIVQESDGSITIELTRAQHVALMKVMSSHTGKALSSHLDSTDLPGVTTIDHDEEFSSIIVTIDETVFPSDRAHVTAWSIGIIASTWQAYAGYDIDVEVTILDSTSSIEAVVALPEDVTVSEGVPQTP